MPGATSGLTAAWTHPSSLSCLLRCLKLGAVVHCKGLREAQGMASMGEPAMLLGSKMHIAASLAHLSDDQRTRGLVASYAQSSNRSSSRSQPNVLPHLGEWDSWLFNDRCLPVDRGELHCGVASSRCRWLRKKFQRLSSHERLISASTCGSPPQLQFSYVSAWLGIKCKTGL